MLKSTLGNHAINFSPQSAFSGQKPPLIYIYHSKQNEKESEFLWTRLLIAKVHLGLSFSTNHVNILSLAQSCFPPMVGFVETYAGSHKTVFKC